MDLISSLSFGLFILLYLWVAYNIPILAIGVRRVLLSRPETERAEVKKSFNLPTMSIVVPARDEERVIGRLLDALLRLDYPPERKEIIIVEDDSNDKTPEICMTYAQQHPRLIKFYHRDVSKGKPSALNFGFRHAGGDVVAVFDADNVPEPDVLMKAARYFEDPSVAAVQGATAALNADESMLTKLISYEEAVWLRNYLQGKDALNLFVPLTGSCQFIRKNVAEEVGLWDENCLAEDLEMSARITEMGYSTKFASDLVSWQEAPSKLSRLIMQRVRWYRGYMEVAIKYGRFLKRLEKKAFDAEITLLGPYVLTVFLLSHAISLYVFMFPSPDPFLSIMSRITLALTILTLLTVGIALIHATRPMRFRNILWLPFIYAYLSLQCVLTAYAFLQIVFRRPRSWVKTEKTGISTTLVSQKFRHSNRQTVAA